ncbi:MAG: amino acid--tRNA ligase-related protein, partial [Myxococcota bacterium]
MNRAILAARDRLLATIRDFFRSRGFLEVSTPLATGEAIPERHIEATPLRRGGRWLQASPELYLKRLLCDGSGPVFEVTRSFRSGEFGAQHRPEFTILEWYRPRDDMEAGIRLLCELVERCLDVKVFRVTSYREAFESELGLDPHAASREELLAVAVRVLGTRAPATGLNVADRDDLLNDLLAFAIEPKLGSDGPEVLYHYPASQAALA